MLPGLPGQGAHIDEGKDFINHFLQILPVHDEDGNKGAQVQQNIKKHMPIVGHFEKVIHDGKMPRTGDGQKFSDPLYKAQQNRVPNAH